MLNGYYGTYYSPESLGVYRFSLDTQSGVPSAPVLVCPARDAKCVAWAGGALVAPVQEEEGAGLVRIVPGEAPRQRLFEKGTGCFLVEDEEYLYSANYHAGTVTVCEKESLKPVYRIEAGEKAGCHQVMLHQNLLLVPCLERDEVRLYDKTRGFAQAGALCFDKGTGPRHGVFNAAHTLLYLVSERSNELYVFAADGARFTLGQRLGVIGAGASAAIRLSPDERFLYVSTRDIPTRAQDVITVFSLAGDVPVRTQQADSGGKHPRDFDLTADGRWLVCLNRDSGGLAVFPVDTQTGLLGKASGRTAAPKASGILLEK